MTCVGRSTSGFKSEALVRSHSKLRDQRTPEKGPWTSPPSSARHLVVPSDGAAALPYVDGPFAGQSVSPPQACRHHKRRQNR